MVLRFVTRWFLRCLLAPAALLPLMPGAGLTVGAAAQPATFDHSDDPREALQRVWWKREQILDVRGGFSLIAAQWRAVGGLSLDLVTRPVTARLGGTLRGGIYGEYGPDLDEPYDLIRLLQFARYNAPSRSGLYLRAGTLDRLRLGTGHLVNFYNSRVAWDERTVGGAFSGSGAYGEVAAFTDNVLLDGLTGGYVALRPLAWADDDRTRSLTFGFAYATDLATHRPGRTPVTGYNVEMYFDALTSGAIKLVPFTSVAWFDGFGSGLGFGADLESPNFIDLASFRLRLALYYNGKSFVPGYFNSFYTVHNPYARIINSEAYLSDDAAQQFEGVALRDAFGGNDLVTELRVLIFEQFEFWYFFRRHYGIQDQSEYHLRLFLRARDRLLLDVGIDRGGLGGFFSLFSELNDQTHLVFDTDYRLYGPLWVFLRARYSFERLDDAPDGTERYLVQRRFEPMTGLRFSF